MESKSFNISDCKDTYLGKAANMTKCISGIDSEDKTCT